MAERLLSAHVRRYNGVSGEKLREYQKMLRENFIEGTKIEADGVEFLNDFAETMVSLLLEAKTSLTREITEVTRLKRQVVREQLARESQPSSDISAPSTELAIASPTSGIQRVDLNKLVKKPRYFDGYDPLPREWIEEYSDAIEDNRWNDATSIYYFKHFLVKDAASWFKLSVRPVMKDDWTFQDLFKEFESNFLGRAERDRLRVLLRTTVMGTEERVATFIPKVLRILLMLTPDMSEKEQVARVSEKLKAMYATAIVDKDPETIAELRDVCRRVEAAMDLRRVANETGRTQRPQLSRVSTNKEDSPRNASINDNQRPWRPIQERRSCFRCGRNNHLLKNCRARTHFNGSPLQDQEKSTSMKANVNAVETKVPENDEYGALVEDTVIEPVLFDDDSVEESLNAIAVTGVLNSSKKLLKRPLQLDGTTTTALIDTGAEVTVAVEELAKKLKWKLSPSKKEIVGADKKPLIVKGQYTTLVSLTLQGIRRSVKHVVFVVEKLAENFILGSDLIRIMSIRIDLANDNLDYGPLVKLNEVNNITSQDRDYINLPNSKEKVGISNTIAEHQKSQLTKLIINHAIAFSLNGEIGCAVGVEHDIELSAKAEPVVEPMRRRAPIHEAEIQKQVRDLLKAGIIEESRSPWASAVVLVKKKTGDLRMCIDYRKLNAVTKKNAYPLPHIQTCLDNLAGKRYFTTFDFCSGYLQIPMSERAKELSAFRTAKGHYQYLRMSFGLCNAPMTFQKLMNEMLMFDQRLQVQVYLDDVCLATRTWEEHIEQLDIIFNIFRNNNLKLKASKCEFAMEKLIFLGHEISADGLRQDPNKLSAISRMPSPIDVSGVRRVVGCFSYYRRFVQRFSELAEPLIRLTRKNVKFVWGGDEQKAFDALKTALVNSSQLAVFNNVDPIMLKTDASSKGIAGMLFQQHNGEWRLIACCSRRINASESKYGPTDLEGLAVVYAIQKFRPYLLGNPFQLVVDHCALCVLKIKLPTSPRIHRWAIILSEFNFEVVYTKGARHLDVDCLSRAPVDDETDNYLEARIMYTVVPVDTDQWDQSYEDEESKEIIAKAVRKEENLDVKDGLIFKDDKLFVPFAKRKDVLKAAHADSSGHGGIKVTMAKLNDCWWPSMHQDAENFVRTCNICQLRKADKSGPKGTMQHFNANEPFEVLSLDTMGPMSNETLNNNKYIIVAVDVFTRFVEAKPLKTVAASEANTFILELFGRFGAPKIVITDRGSQFVNSLVQGTLKSFGIQHRLGVPDHGPSNAVAERVIQVIQEKISLSSSSNVATNNWDVILPTVVLAINTSLHSIIKLTPFEMVFGRKYNRIGDQLITETSPQDVHTRLIKESLAKNHLLARESQTREKEASKVAFDSSHKPTEYNIGDKVVVRVSDRRRGKLSLRYQGPYTIIKKEKDIYLLKDDKKTIARHVASLKRYNTGSSIMLSLLLLFSLISMGLCQLPNAPVLWRRVTDTFVYDRTINYDITLGIVNPCDSLRKAAAQFNSTYLSANGTSNPYKSEVQDPHIHMADKCDEIYKEKWLNAVQNTMMKCSPLQLHELNPAVDASHTKRGWVSNIVSAAPGFAGGFAGFVVSDLVGVAWDYLNPYSDHNRLNRLESQVRENVEKHGKMLNAFVNATRALSDGLNMLNKEMISTKKTLSQVISDIPEFIFAALKLFNFITEASKYMEAIGRGCESDTRYVDMKGLFGLLQHKSFKNVQSRRTYMTSVEEIADAINFKFSIITPSPDTQVYSVDPFEFWEFDGKDSMSLMHYNGERRLIYNTSADCAKAVDFTKENPVLWEVCDNRSYHDPNLAIWTPEEPVPLEAVKPRFQMKTDFKSNLIYCFPANVSVNGILMPCDNRPMKLGVWVPFSVPGIREYNPSTVRGNFTLQEQEFSITYTHLSANSSYTSGSMALYKKIADLNKEVEATKEEGKIENFIDKVQISTWGIVILNIVLLLFLLSVAGCIYYCCCIKKAQSSAQNVNINLADLSRKDRVTVSKKLGKNDQLKEEEEDEEISQTSPASPGRDFAPETFARRKSFKLTSHLPV